MKDIIIVGASGFGRELVQYIEDINSINPEWNILGFIDDNPYALNGSKCPYSIIGNIKDWQPRENEYYVCGLAIPHVKYEIVSLLKDKGGNFISLIHPTASVSHYAELGEGVVITPRSHVNPDTKVGNFVSILGSGIGHDAIIGDFSTLSGRCNINGHVHIGEKVYVACGVSIAPSKKIGNDAYIGIGSVVISNVKAGTKVFGNPAKKIDL